MALIDKLTAIANTIRFRTGSSESLTLDEMVTAIEGINGSVNDGTTGYIVDRSISGNYTNNDVTTIGEYALYKCKNLSTVNFPAVTSIGIHAFESCSSLMSVKFESATSIGRNTFVECSSLTSFDFPSVTTVCSNAFSLCSMITNVTLPKVTKIEEYAFDRCYSLTTIDLPSITYIGAEAFGSTELTTLIIRTEGTVCTLAGILGESQISLGNGSIYVLDDLVNSYKTATNWSAYANQIKPLSEYMYS